MNHNQLLNLEILKIFASCHDVTMVEAEFNYNPKIQITVERKEDLVNIFNVAKCTPQKQMYYQPIFEEGQLTQITLYSLLDGISYGTLIYKMND